MTIPAEYHQLPNGTLRRNDTPVIDYGDYWGKCDRSTMEEQRWNVHGHLSSDGKTKTEAVIKHCIGRTLLEVGCAPGEFLSVASDLYGYRVEGVEISPEYADMVATYSRARVHCGLFVDMEIPTRYDNVVAMDVLEHVEDGEQFIAKCRSVLNPGGRIVLMFPAIYEDGEFDARFFCEEHLWFYSKQHLRDWLHPIVFDRWCVGHEIIVVQT